MTKEEYIAEAKKRGYSDSTIQELLGMYEKYAQMGHPSEYEFCDEIDEVLNVRYTYPEDLLPLSGRISQNLTPQAAL